MSARTKNMLAFLPLLIVVAGLLSDTALGCPNCKEAYMADGAASPVASGFNTSILFLMAMPFVVIGAFTFRLWIAMRKKNGDVPTT